MDLYVNIRNSKHYKEMGSYEAVAIAEGFCNHDPSSKEQQAAWQYIIDTGMWKILQGFFGRTAKSLIEQGICKKPK